MTFSLIFVAVGILFIVLGIMIYRGRVDLIHDYHQSHIPPEKKRDYGKEFSYGMFFMGICFICTAALVAWIKGFPDLIFSLGMILGVAWLIAVQIKYNGGLF